MTDNYSLEQTFAPPGQNFWKPFTEDHERFQFGWWDDWSNTRPGYSHAEFFAWSNEEGDVQARVKLDRDPGLTPYLTAAASAARPYLEIVLLDVRSDVRGRGVGRRIVSAIVEKWPDRHVVALSEADDFWRALGWTEHIHAYDDGSRSLFLAPEPKIL